MIAVRLHLLRQVNKFHDKKFLNFVPLVPQKPSQDSIVLSRRRWVHRQDRWCNPCRVRQVRRQDIQRRHDAVQLGRGGSHHVQGHRQGFRLRIGIVQRAQGNPAIRGRKEFGYFGPDSEESVAWTIKNAYGGLSTLEEYMQRDPLQLETA